jgi:pimeloyl-ACP methyl ester carboxylesterase
MRTAESGADSGGPCSVCNISPAHWTTGIPPSRIRWATAEVILFDSAGVGRSTGTVPTTVAGMATHALRFLDGLCVTSCDVLGFSLGGMVAQQIALDRPSNIHRMILVGTAPRGGEDIMHLENPV